MRQQRRQRATYYITCTDHTKSEHSQTTTMYSTLLGFVVCPSPSRPGSQATGRAELKECCNTKTSGKWLHCAVRSPIIRVRIHPGRTRLQAWVTLFGGCFIADLRTAGSSLFSLRRRSTRQQKQHHLCAAVRANQAAIPGSRGSKPWLEALWLTRRVLLRQAHGQSQELFSQL